MPYIEGKRWSFRSNTSLNRQLGKMPDRFAVPVGRGSIGGSPRNDDGQRPRGRGLWRLLLAGRLRQPDCEQIRVHLAQLHWRRLFQPREGARQRTCQSGRSVLCPRRCHRTLMQQALGGRVLPWINGLPEARTALLSASSGCPRTSPPQPVAAAWRWILNPSAVGNHPSHRDAPVCEDVSRWKPPGPLVEVEPMRPAARQ
jgi:hypothetical protein